MQWSFRYTFAKIAQAFDVHQAMMKKQMEKFASAELPSTAQANEIATRVGAAVSAALFTPLTKVIRFTGPAMAPTLNRESANNKDAFEFLLVRQLPDPTAVNVSKGDVVCLRHPIGVQQSSLLVRRVTACGGEVLTSKDSEYILADNVVWVEADNVDLEPPHVEDSRTFGPVPLGNVLGRCVYSFASSVDQGYIQNSTDTKEDDVSVVEVELTEQLKKELEQCKASIHGSA